MNQRGGVLKMSGAISLALKRSIIQHIYLHPTAKRSWKCFIPCLLYEARIALLKKQLDCIDMKEIHKMICHETKVQDLREKLLKVDLISLEKDMIDKTLDIFCLSTKLSTINTLYRCVGFISCY